MHESIHATVTTIRTQNNFITTNKLPHAIPLYSYPLSALKPGKH